MANTAEATRIVSLDQFRGYTVLGMFFVNFAGSLAAVPAFFKHHHTYCSYADTIMPQFFFAVGFAYRLTLLKRLETVGAWPAYGHVIRRSFGLILLGAVLYHADGRAWTSFDGPGLGSLLFQTFKRTLFQTLVHIGVTSLWVLPVVAAGPLVRIVFAGCSGLLHLGLSYQFYYQWVNEPPRGIDGGPLGFLTWTIPLIAGTLAYDMVRACPHRAPVGRLLLWGAVLMMLGYGLSCLNRVTPPNTALATGVASWLVEPPFVPPSQPVNLWAMSQRSGSLTYLTFGAGFSLAVYALFVLACDVGRWQVGIFRTLGGNALAAYVVHELVGKAVKPFVPGNAPLWYVLAAFGVFLAVCYLFIRYLEKNRLYLRL